MTESNHSKQNSALLIIITIMKMNMICKYCDNIILAVIKCFIGRSSLLGILQCHQVVVISIWAICPGEMAGAGVLYFKISSEGMPHT